MSEKFVINGGNIPRGEIEARGAKNATFPILAATLLTNKECIIDNIPLIEDVFRMIGILESLGAEISWIDKRKIKVKCSNVDLNNLPEDIIRKFRGSVLLFGSLIARFNRLETPSPGGCLIGARSLDTHFDAFEQMGVKFSDENGKYSFVKISEKNFFEVVLKEFSVTATENVLLFSSLGDKNTILKIADFDYQVQELIKVLRKMGAEIELSGYKNLKIRGKKELNGFTHSIISDPLEAGTFVALALATNGDVTIKNAEISFLELFLKRLKDFGANFKILDSKTIRVMPSKKIKIDKVQVLPYPGIHTDLQPELGVLSTQTEGLTLIHDPLYEGRLKYLEELNKMGADIIFSDPHRAIINGPTALVGIEVPAPDLRAGAAFIIAGAIAKGETTIRNIYQIDRGYERIEERLQKIGIDIKRLKD